MTDQVNLDLIWALTGGVTDPDIASPGKFETGWVEEIPTFQNFNFVLQILTKNLLVLAEKGHFDWQTEITYKPGTRVLQDGKVWTCVLEHSGQDPAADISFTYWNYGTFFGNTLAADYLGEYGIQVKRVNQRNSGTVWDGSDITVDNRAALVELVTTNAATKNWLLGNVSGELVAVDIDTTIVPDGRSIALAEPTTHRLFHEGHQPDVSEVTDAVEEAPQDGKTYVRIDGGWVEATSTIVSANPPFEAAGTTIGWFSLTEGKYYLDINDGDSSQWVPANPPTLPVSKAIDVQYDNSADLMGSNVQEALSGIYGKLGNNLILNSVFEIETQSGDGGITPSGENSVSNKWKLTNSGLTGVYSTLNPTAASGWFGFARISPASWIAGDWYALRQEIHEVQWLVGQPVTLGFNMVHTGVGTVNMHVSLHSSDGGVETLIAEQDFDIVTGNLANYRHYMDPITITPGLTPDFLVLRFTNDTGDEIEVNKVQLEEGSFGTPYKYDRAVDEVSCARFFQTLYPRKDGTRSNWWGLNLVNPTGSVLKLQWEFPVPMIKTPAMLFQEDFDTFPGTRISSKTNIHTNERLTIWDVVPLDLGTGVYITKITANAD